MSTQINDRPKRATFTIDRAYMRQQTREAIKTFVAPLAGVYAALTNPLAERQD